MAITSTEASAGETEGLGSSTLSPAYGAILGKIDATSTMPRWLQVKHRLRDLATLHMKPGERLPTEVSLCAHFKISRVTARQALAALVDEGILERHQGRGTYVCEPRMREQIGGREHFLIGQFEYAEEGSIMLHTAEVDYAAEWIVQRLNLQPGAKITKIRKVLTHRGQPVAFKTTFIPVHLAPDLTNYNLLPPLDLLLEERFGLHASYADESIEVIMSDAFRSGILGLPEGHPLILLELLACLEDGTRIELSRTYYDAHKFRFERRISRSSD